MFSPLSPLSSELSFYPRISLPEPRSLGTSQSLAGFPPSQCAYHAFVTTDKKVHACCHRMLHDDVATMFKAKPVV